MCAIFGLIDYNHTLNAKQREKLLRVLSEECEERGTDATGYAFNHNGKLTKYICICTMIPTSSWGIPEWQPRVTSSITATITHSPARLKTQASPLLTTVFFITM